MLLDDHELIRVGTSLWLSKEPDLEVVGSFSTGKELLAALAIRQPDILVIDFMLGPTEIDGINLIRALRVRYPDCRPLVLSAHYTPATVSLALRAGSWGFFGKTQRLDGLAAAIRTVARGKIYLHPIMAREVATVSEKEVYEAANVNELAPVCAHDILSPREREVLRCFLDGMSVNGIAEKFSRSANTISTQKQSAYRKLGIKTDSELFKLSSSLRDSSAMGF
ncbi:response regulator [Pseudomonas gingeri]|uniref:Response regulator transcription factor n=1 Tax=Pseudomonas gingeri TaxID=117681 RepID=A0A7Y7YE39_9PSED|nr:response regulator transcription factor [Pseudomonas gingeri]NWA04310.1 response regulator transcription factor [Pseudomonas gingeri]NWA15115.1 response regulator transcription factor [Pseudomonas gingeri]NWA54556.1 response regulator transcription factor [Pseudomonas gingeri]NWA98313.1 response regulator transcription factor [Pseudomonas gingeri]NWB04173.1 response regulator transcription factor [Pseudomonas gingeri]